MATLVLLKYNNYYNRIVKFENSVDKYRGYQISTDVEGANFIPNDYINTEVIINMITYGIDPDYLLVLDEDSNITSRWFVISTERTTARQYRLTLHRDLIVDFYDHILDAPFFIEKATISDINDPAIYNREDMTFNQIKLAEIPLKDNSGTAWIVGYVPRDSFKNATPINVNMPYSGVEDITVDKLSDYTYYTFTQQEFNSDARDVLYGLNTYVTGSDQTIYNATFNMFDDGNNGPITNVEAQGLTANRPYQYIGRWAFINGTFTIYENVFSNATAETLAAMKNLLPAFTNAESDSAFNNLLSEEGKIIYNREDGQYYKVQLAEYGKVTETVTLNPNASLGVYLKRCINQARFVGTPNNETFQVKYSYYRNRLVLTLLDSTITTTISGEDNRYHLNDSPYDMFFLPFPAVGQKLPIFKNGVEYIAEVSREAAFNIATQIAASSGAGNIYDLQLLPYCPFQGIIKADGTIDIGDTLNSPISVQVGETESKVVSVLLWATSSEFSLRIPFSIPQSNTVIDKKVKNETQFWRLCSPNYSGVFEFSPEKNNGVNYINVDCSYKPFNPYIHLSIDFNNLYGQEFGDSRGLICGGDFSLPQTTSAWADYQLNNKNFQQMFDRDIKSMEVIKDVQRERELWQVAAGTLSAGASGAGAGAMAMGPWGALAGIGTAGASLAGGLRDIRLNESLRQEALDYKRDMFGYQMGNIKALPQSLAKVSAFTRNNKIFPFLEHYGCTEKEEKALKDKLTYNGMTVMRIGRIAEFQQSTPSYIKGRLIRLETIGEDFHIINAIADELFKGVFI